ncbi:MAG: hypothetical protein CMB99_01425 [Flavobacteriaceae bacterium]|nr:hypothetical protein [Flavobacteriaceae bacterium]
MLLYRVVNPRNPTGARADEPGVHPDDATEYSQFKADFKVPKPAAGGKPVGAGEPEPSGAVGKSSAAPPPPPPAPAGPPPKAVSPGLPDDDDLTIVEWLKLAHSMDIPMSKSDKATRPKADMIAIIRGNAAAYDKKRGAVV